MCRARLRIGCRNIDCLRQAQGCHPWLPVGRSHAGSKVPRRSRNSRDQPRYTGSLMVPWPVRQAPGVANNERSRRPVSDWTGLAMRQPVIQKSAEPACNGPVMAEPALEMGFARLCTGQ